MKRDADAFVDVVIHMCFFADASSQPDLNNRLSLALMMWQNNYEIQRMFLHPSLLPSSSTLSRSMHTYKYNVCIDFRDQTDRSETCFFSHTHFTTELWNQCYGRICMEELATLHLPRFPALHFCLNLMYWHEPLVLKLPLPPPSLASLHPKAPAKGRFPPALAPRAVGIKINLESTPIRR